MPAIVVEADSGVVLYAERALEPWRPASLTKLMTLYLVFEALDAGTLDPEDPLIVSAHAASQPPTHLGLAAGDIITVADAITALAVRSANDMAVVLAERVAGDEATFAELMTFRAGDLGMSRTRFANASGLPDPGNVTDARDMAMLARAIVRHFPARYGLFATRSFEFRGGVLPTYNGFLTRYEGADGIKTGFTCAAGYNLIGSAVRNGRRLIGVVLGGHSRGERRAAMVRLLDRGFATAAGDGTLDLLTASAATASAPPVVIPQSECGRDGEAELVISGVNARGVAPADRIGISGWGLTLGIYPDRKTARARVSAARDHLQDAGGKPLLVERRAAGITRYTALLVGLSQQQATKVCRQLRALKAYCVTLGPEALRNPRAMWW